MKRNCIALIIIIMISVGGAFHLPANAAKPAADKSEKAEYEQRIEQLEKVVQQKTDSITLLDQQMKLAEYVEKKADRNMDMNIGLFGALITFLSIFVPLTINKNHQKRLEATEEKLDKTKQDLDATRKELDEASKKSEQSAADLAQLETKLQTYSEQAVAEITELKTQIQEYSNQAEKSVQESNDSAQEAKALTFFMQALKEEDLDRKIIRYTQAIELNPNYAEAYYNRGIAYTHKGEYDNAIKDYNKAIEIINPNDAEAYSNLGVAYNLMGEIDKYIEDYNKSIIEIIPNDADAYNIRGCAEKFIAEMLEKDGKLAEALGLFKKAVEDFDKFLELCTKDDDNRKNAIQLKQLCEAAIRRLEDDDGMAEAVPLPKK